MIVTEYRKKKGQVWEQRWQYQYDWKRVRSEGRHAFKTGSSRRKIGTLLSERVCREPAMLARFGCIK